MLDNVKGTEEMKLLKRYLQEERELLASEAASLLVNVLFWFDVDINAIIGHYNQLKAQKAGGGSFGN